MNVPVKTLKTIWKMTRDIPTEGFEFKVKVIPNFSSEDIKSQDFIDLKSARAYAKEQSRTGAYKAIVYDKQGSAVYKSGDV